MRDIRSFVLLLLFISCNESARVAREEQADSSVATVTRPSTGCARVIEKFRDLTFDTLEVASPDTEDGFSHELFYGTPLDSIDVAKLFPGDAGNYLLLAASNAGMEALTVDSLVLAKKFGYLIKSSGTRGNIR